ncbi:MAG: hypothetical protein A2X00_10580 [Bacteroidetes bacterium GWE2_32_14]|nr:MAG: hypothetical protein A2X00_10580 [Bacteroidetes bacterium GWE2_32_14]
MKTKTFVQKIEYIAEKFSGKTAIKTVDKVLSYEQLNRKSNCVATIINDKLDRDSNVSLLFDHDENIVIGILGVLKAQKTYVALNKSYPKERLMNILKDCESNLLLTDSKNLALAYKLNYESKQNISIVNIDELNEVFTNNAVTSSDDKDAYIIYTSGSTGKPKGVVQTISTINHFIEYYIKELDINENDNILLTTSYSHTVSVLDIFSALLTGATLSIYDISYSLGIDHFIKWLSLAEITIIHTVPVFYRYFVCKIDNKLILSKIRLILLGGEDVFKTDFQLYKDSFPESTYFINLYGQSEVLVGTINILNKESKNERASVSIGYPVEILNAYVIDNEDKELNIYETGELVFEGESLTTRYLNLPNETNDLFDFIGDKKILRTGDLVKKLPDGTLEFIGRKDFQFKINGNRVNPKEIEIILDKMENVAKSIVVPINNERQEKYIAAYYTSNSKTQIQKKEITDYLLDKLPEYMIPSSFIYLENFPVGETGKIMRNKLPQFTMEDIVVVPDVISESLSSIWKKVFDITEVGMFDNFFQLGGNSLLATEMINMIYFEFDLELKLNSIFENQTIFELSKLIKSKI